VAPGESWPSWRSPPGAAVSDLAEGSVAAETLARRQCPFLPRWVHESRRAASGQRSPPGRRSQSAAFPMAASSRTILCRVYLLGCPAIQRGSVPKLGKHPIQRRHVTFGRRPFVGAKRHLLQYRVTDVIASTAITLAEALGRLNEHPTQAMRCGQVLQNALVQ
jgi:hypothetical protein